MKHFYYVASLSIVLTQVLGKDITPNNDIEEKILQLFTQWRSGDIESLPFALPALDVIKIPPLNGSYTGGGLTLTYSTSEIQVIGLSNFSVVDLNVSESNLEASGVIRIPISSISADKYNLKGRAYFLYSLIGAGKMNITVRDTELLFSIRLAYNGTGTSVDEMVLDFHIDSIKVNLENSSWPLNRVLSNNGVSMIEGYHEDIVNNTRADLICRFDKYLGTVTPEQLFNVLGADDCNCVEC